MFNYSQVVTWLPVGDEMIITLNIEACILYRINRIVNDILIVSSLKENFNINYSAERCKNSNKKNSSPDIVLYLITKAQKNRR